MNRQNLNFIYKYILRRIYFEIPMSDMLEINTVTGNLSCLLHTVHLHRSL